MSLKNKTNLKRNNKFQRQLSKTYFTKTILMFLYTYNPPFSNVFFNYLCALRFIYSIEASKFVKKGKQGDIVNKNII